ncbi:hypothetical protein [Phenylobacterium sp.]|jgi:hypothetical protein|uniref:hypothetical protein n=1 Tax=Phenylobacterium sp. TaxID=1871053 RepID=UPI003783F94A
MAREAPSHEVDRHELYRVVSTAFDGRFYRLIYDDVAQAGLDALRHYLGGGWREGRDPAPWFNVRAYLEANADVRKADAEPLHHYLTVGRREGREVVPSRHSEAFLVEVLERGERPGWRLADLLPPAPAADVRAAAAPIATPTVAAPADRALIEAEFDAAFYLGANPDIAAAGSDPLDHFLTTGWREGRDPHPRFSVRDYLDIYVDIAQAGINPFVHYVRTGRAEGRIGRNDLGFRYQLIADLQPVADRAARIAEAAAQLPVDPPEHLAEALQTSRTGLADLHVTFSHDDYSANTGGVQLCLQREDARVAELGRDHLHFYPAKPWPVVREAGEAGPLGVLWNGRQVGVFAPEAIAPVLKAAAGRPGHRTFAIHSLLGHAADETADILAAVGLKAGWFWLHDFASLCAGYHLLRNDVQDCAAPPPDSPACTICAYLPMRARHLAAHERLFARLDLTVVSPSQATLDLWRASWNYPTAGELVLPHARLSPRGPAPAARKGRPFRLAYAGVAAPHKGWPLFRELVLRHADDPRYQFVHLGVATPGGLPLEFHEVRVTEQRPRLMQETLEALDVDAVLVWPLCRETFSFTAYEAVAAGCAVITNPDSGNVAAFVTDGGHGQVLLDEAALTAAFDTGEVAALSRAARKPQVHDLTFSALTVDLFEGAAA